MQVGREAFLCFKWRVTAAINLAQGVPPNGSDRRVPRGLRLPLLRSPHWPRLRRAREVKAACAQAGAGEAASESPGDEDAGVMTQQRT